MPLSCRSLPAVILVLAVLPAAAQARFGLAAGEALRIHNSPGGPLVLVLPARTPYFQVLAEQGNWVRVRSLPSAPAPYDGWTPAPEVRLYPGSSAARRAYFETHPLRERVKPMAAAIGSDYWDLRDQGVDRQAGADLWLRYGFDFTEWYVARGRNNYAELREIADIQSADEDSLVLTLFVAAETTPPESLEIQLAGDTRLLIRARGGPAFRFGRARAP